METRFLIYLDTHVILWLYARAKHLIEDDRDILISPMVLLELDYLHEVGQTTLASTPVYDYLHQRIDLQVCKKAFADVIQTASQQSWTRDPFDRIITAQAAIDKNSFITKDKIIREHYEHTVW